MSKVFFIWLFTITIIFGETVPTMENITKLYIATFERVPDSKGINYWINDSNLSVEKIAESFFDQNETKVKYPNSYSNDKFINTIYLNLFNREADMKGHAYWLDKLDRAEIDKSLFILAIINGALGTDKEILKNKTIVSLVFASQENFNINELNYIINNINEDTNSVYNIFDEYSLLNSNNIDILPMSKQGLNVSRNIDINWDNGSCYTVEILNPTNENLEWNIELKLLDDIYISWNANYIKNEDLNVSIFTGKEENKIIKSNEIIKFGYCLNNNIEDVSMPVLVDNSELLSNNLFSTKDYANVLGLSLEFYEAQRSSGLFPRVNWREEAFLNDGDEVGVDLSGGLFTREGTIKSNLAMAYTATMINWSIFIFPESYTGQNNYEQDQIRYILDYLMKTFDQGFNDNNSSDDIIYYQVGNQSKDDSYWGVPQEASEDREVYICKNYTTCAGVSSQMVAALASGYLSIKEDISYKVKLLEKAEKLYLFSKNNINSLDKSFNDELSWAATWLYLATNKIKYLDDAKIFIDKVQFSTSDMHDLDNVYMGTLILLYGITDDIQYKYKIDTYFNHWFTTITYTEGGLAFYSNKMPLKYSSTVSFLALVYAKNFDNYYQSSLVSFARSQIDYILGDNPINSSYIVGYGDNSPINPHHKASHNSIENSIKYPINNEFILRGALVGGPKSLDDLDYQDNREDNISNGVSINSNAGLTAALSGLVSMAQNILKN